MTPGPVGVLAMAYGSPARPDDIATYYTHIRRGRPPSDEQLANLRARYDALGGLSVLTERTAAQRTRLTNALDAAAPDRFVVAAGNKHAAPFIEDGVAELVSRDVAHIVGIVLAPHYSAASVGEYQARAADAAAANGTEVRPLNQWHLLPELIAYNAAAVREALGDIGTPKASTKVLFTAHSLPERVLAGDPYPAQLRAGATATAVAAGLHRWAGWSMAWQSAGATPEPWRGPDVRDVITDLAETGRADGVVVCPHGFTSAHLEVAYDLDIEAAGIAADAGLAFRRTRVVDDDPGVFGAIATKVVAIADGATDPVDRAGVDGSAPAVGGNGEP